MAIVFPLAYTFLEDIFHPLAFHPTLMPQQMTSQQASGGVIVKDLGPPLWRADIVSRWLTQREALKAIAALNSLQGSIGTFYIYSTLLKNPQADPRGTTLGASIVKIKTVYFDGFDLKGLPAGYVISVGDRLTINSLYHYYEVLETATADGSGNTNGFFTQPKPLPGAAVDQVVALLHPIFLAVMVPGSLKQEIQGRLTKLSFTAQQVFS